MRICFNICPRASNLHFYRPFGGKTNKTTIHQNTVTNSQSISLLCSTINSNIPLWPQKWLHVLQANAVYSIHSLIILMESEGNTMVFYTPMITIFTYHGIGTVPQCSSQNTMVYSQKPHKTLSFKSVGMARVQWRHTLTAVWKITGFRLLDQPTDNVSYSKNTLKRIVSV